MAVKISELNAASSLDGAIVPIVQDGVTHKSNLSSIIVGIVRQSVGVPTGAVIERGTGNGGEYVRFADGTQICWARNLTVDVTSASGSLYRNATSPTFLFPADFIGNNRVVMPLVFSGVDIWAASDTTTSNTTATLRFLSNVSRAGVSVGYIAIGRWF